MTNILSRDTIVSRILEAKINKNKDNATYSYACVMAYFDIKDWKKHVAFIEEDDVYYSSKKEDKDNYGVEPEPHVTILYGLEDDKLKVQDVLDDLTAVKGPIKIKITGISMFENDEFDVLKYTVKSTQLTKLNSKLKKYPHQSTYPDYIPHMTLAYLKKGTGKKYIKEFDEAIELETTKIVYSMQCGQKLVVHCQDVLNESLYEKTVYEHNLDLNLKFPEEKFKKTFLQMLDYMYTLGYVGSSRSFKVYVDGDGAFRLNMILKNPEDQEYLNTIKNEIDDDDNVSFDFD